MAVTASFRERSFVSVYVSMHAIRVREAPNALAWTHAKLFVNVSLIIYMIMKK